MTKREYREFVRRANTMTDAFTALCWELGDLLLETIPKGIKEGEVLTIIRKFKEDTGCDLTTRTLTNLRKCSHEWPPEERTFNCPWIVYWSLQHNKKDIKRNMKIHEAIVASPIAKATV